MAPLLRSADGAIANFEAATGVPGATTMRMAYAAPPGWLAQLPEVGVRAVTLANNHACDLGESGLEATLAEVEASHLVGIGADDDDPWSPRVVAERDGKRICAVGWTTLMNARGLCARSNRLASLKADARGKRRIDRVMSRAKAECDATVAIFHGGEEYAEQTREMIDLAARAAESGADAVVIHHPHVASPVVVRSTKDGRRVPIFTSVGNLVTNQGESYRDSMYPVLAENRRMVCVNAWTRLGVLADLSFDFAGAEPTLTWGYHLVWTDNSHAEDRSAPVPKIETRLVDPVADRKLLGRLAEDRQGPQALLRDACWIGGPTYDPAKRAPRCLVPFRADPPAAVFDSRPAADDNGRHVARRRALPRPPQGSHSGRQARP